MLFRLIVRDDCCTGQRVLRLSELDHQRLSELDHQSISGLRHCAQVDPGGLPLVSCAPLGFVLERLALRHVHFWSLDVEGAELEVLRTVDFSQVPFVKSSASDFLWSHITNG